MSLRPYTSILFAAAIAHGLTLLPVVAAEITPEQRDFFEKKIRPALVENCYKCHAADSKKIGGKLLLDSPEALLKGGESGPPVIAGNPGESLLIESLSHQSDLAMPPKKPLPEPVIADFVKWIAMGAPDPREPGTLLSDDYAKRDYEEGSLWALEPPRAPKVPATDQAGWPREPIDHFTLAKMKSKGLSPALDASPEVLLRRLHFDLTGLPPTPADLDLFLASYLLDPDKATSTVVDDLLASPHFGEHWGRHWLDVARYAESNGNDGLSRNPTFPHAWRYRDYVIESFNNDTPYDRFLTEQIAGDLLPHSTPQERDRNLIATGFLALGAKPAKAMNDNFAMDVVADQIEVIGNGLLGISIACARCHDHKFDPVSAKDYYAMAGFFTSSNTMWGLAGNEGLTAPPTDLHVLESAPKSFPPLDFVETVVLLQSNTGKPKPIPAPPWPKGTPLAMGIKEGKAPADCRLNIKGESKKLGAPIPRGFPEAIPGPSDLSIPADKSGRAELAQWITHPDNPLTARVIANRIWQHLFGQGIVATPNDFGVYGERPTHPELLDFLAIDLVKNHWSMKALIRKIVLSRTYQLSAKPRAEAEAADTENQWLSYHSRRRLAAEPLRDSILKVSGQLDPRPGEGSLIRHRDILVNLGGNLHEPSNHRSIYLCYLRGSMPSEIAAFDLPGFLKSEGKRTVSTIPGQALFLYNHDLVIEQSTILAERLLEEESATDERRVENLYREVLLRAPDPGERYRALEFVQLSSDDLRSNESAWAALAQALFMTNEFRYID
ncbi:MAG: PSD1 and planctomycete cytochrome C domain-containing protein [Verrucomicrobiales bacterium]|nr:PSD1 and planctomycete cytochrome C domain-containing protein [Verrucomicrobiales bacterium]